MSRRVINEALLRISSGNCALVYITPETFFSAEIFEIFKNIASAYSSGERNTGIVRFVIDEVHFTLQVSI